MTTDLLDETARCVATSKRSGNRCKRRPIEGGTVCAMHGGSAPQVQAAAARRVLTQQVEADAAAVLATIGVTGVDDPLHELALLASEARAFQDAIGARVNALQERIRFSSDQGTEQLRSEVALYERAMDRTGRFLEVLVRSGFEERRVRISEATAALLAGTITRILDQLELTAAQRELVATVVPAELRATAELEASAS